MNLLIVDDEDLTREGILSSIDWNTLGIHNIYQADDGINGLALVRKYKPEIILSDVRMPRMNGIEMAEKIREIVPDSHIIFMSGYSDKEYLKAAIRLKAVSYVEKPLQPSEVEDAVKEAISNDRMLQLQKDSASRQLRDISEKLAIKVTHPIPDSELTSVEETFEKLGFPLRQASYFTTIIIKIMNRNNPESLNLPDNIPSILESAAEKMQMHGIYARKTDEYILYHVFSPERPLPSLLLKLADQLSDYLTERCHFYIAVGKTVSGITRIFDSYNTAVVLLQHSFFYAYNTVLEPEKDSAPKTQPPYSDPAAPFHEALSSKNIEDARSVANRLYSSLLNSRSILPNHARDLYYKLFAELYESAALNYIQLSEINGGSETITDYISRSNNLDSLHKLLMDKTELFFASLEKGAEKNSTVFLIKDYISKNYQNEALSVKDISEHVFLSASYVCTVFKNETGKTLNQYLTEYRMEKAKKLLRDPRYKITEVSSRVGYSDGNYFGKTFRKYAGLSPSEYREQNAK